MKVSGIALLLLCVGTFLIGMGIGAEILKGDTEYQITLIDQNTVKIQAMDSGRTYYCAPEEITETIDKDNL